MSLRTMIGTYFLKTVIRSHYRKPKVSGFREAGNIGILFEASSEEDMELLRKYARYLKEERKKYHLLGFVDKNKVPDNLKDSVDMTFFCKKDLNWHLKPAGGNATRFLSMDFDILIDLSSGDSIPLRYICAMSDARFKVGRMSDKGRDIYDMMISLGEDVVLREQFKQIDHYLNMINSQ